MKSTRGLAITLILGLGGCYNAGPYGYDRHYVPLEFEEDLVERAQEAVFNEVRTDPEDFGGVLVSWFGVVEQVTGGDQDTTLLRLSFRTHQERHLCFDQERDTCRVTVSEASSGTFTVRLRLRPDDRQGVNTIGSGSLVRVYCSVTGEYDAEGGPLLSCDQYRHWPRGQWAHTGMRVEMRR